MKNLVIIVLLSCALIGSDFGINKFIQGCVTVGQKRAELKNIWLESGKNAESYKSLDIEKKLNKALEDNDTDAIIYYGNLYTSKLKARNEWVKSTIEYIAVGAIYLDECSILYTMPETEKEVIVSEYNGLKNFKKMLQMLDDNKAIAQEDYTQLKEILDKTITKFKKILEER